MGEEVCRAGRGHQRPVAPWTDRSLERPFHSHYRRSRLEAGTVVQAHLIKWLVYIRPQPDSLRRGGIAAFIAKGAAITQGCRTYPFVVDHLNNSFTINHLTYPCSQSVLLCSFLSFWATDGHKEAGRHGGGFRGPRGLAQCATDAAPLERTAHRGGVRGAQPRRRLRGDLAVGRAKALWLRGFLRLDYGVASPDTFERVFALLDPKQFERAFRTWVGGIIPAVGKAQVIAIDGKSSRRATSKAAAAPLHLVNAFAANVGVVLGQTATAEKSNEITAIPELLKELDIEGCSVTIDAMGTQTKIARAIRERGAHYVLCVKDNHPKLLDSIIFADIDPRGPLTPSSTHETTSTGHGRIEVRRCTAFDATDRLHKAEAWKDVASFAVVERVRTVGERNSTERVYYVSSLPADA